MGIRKKLDSLLRKGLNTSKFKGVVNMAISRLAVFKNQRQARGNIARSDVVEFLKLGYHERALLRVEQVIKEQNMLDVYALLEGYLHLLIERVSLIKQEKECPDELVEAVSSLIYAASRCGDFPELQEIRKIFASHFGKDFVARAVELRNNCGVNPKVIQKFSTKMPTLENKMKVLQDIATDNKIVMQNEMTTPPIKPEDEDSRKGNKQNNSIRHEFVEAAVDITESQKFRVKYRDVAHAAQAAFESAAYAAVAARAAVELSRSESIDPDDPNPPNHQPRKFSSATFDPTLDETDSSEDESDEIEPKFEEVKIDSRSLAREVVFDQSDDENDDTIEGSGKNLYNSTVEYFPLRSGAGFKPEPEFELENSSAFEKRNQSSEPLNINRRPMSVRNKWRQGM